MAEKTVNGLGKVLAVVFTSFVAPVLVHVATRDAFVDDAPKEKEPAKKVAPPAPTPAAAPTGGVTQVIAKGVGKTPEEAVRQAINTALVRAVAAQVDADTWARSGEVLRAAVTSDSDMLIRGYRELAGGKEWKLRGTLHTRELAVDVNRAALLERLTQYGPRRTTENWRRVITPTGNRG